MFPIDISLLPSLSTRKALLVVDAQNDFLAEDGALPIRMPYDLPQRISDLAGNFRRSGGEIIWVQSCFESSRSIDEEQIMVSDTSSPSPGSAPAPPRGRRPRATPPVAEDASPEAFLTLGAVNEPNCVKAGSAGIEMHPIIRQAVGSGDHVLTKTFYSAFRVDGLLGLLRMRLVTELFICGSLTNVGVMATAVDAARYGYTITIVDDCCGSQSISGHRTALRQITDTTGCETLSAAGVLNAMRPQPRTSTSGRGGQQRQDRGAAGGRSPTVRLRRGRDDAVAPSPASDIQPSLERMSLSGEPAAADEYASETLAPPTSPRRPPQPPQPQAPLQHRQQQRQPQSRSQRQSQSRPAVQSVAGSGNTQAEVETDRDTIASARSPTQQSQVINGDASGSAGAAGRSSTISATTSAAASDEIPDRGRSRHGSGRSDEQAVVVVEEGADPVTWGSISSSASKQRSQQKRTPPPLAAAGAAQPTTPLSSSSGELLRPNNANANADDVDNGNVNADNKARNKSKGVESPRTTHNTDSASDSKALSESSAASAAGIKTRRDNNNHNDGDIAASTNHPPETTDFKTRDSKTSSSNTMATPPAPRKESEPLCEGDTQVIYDVLPASLEADIFARLRSEVAWKRMSHQGGEVPRLVAVQGLVAADGSKPVYRHPADSSPPLHPFTQAVNEVRAVVEEALGHELNHVLIQLYRGGADYISEHSDKTLDIARGSFIANVSLGAERTMTLRTKRRAKTSASDSGVAEGGGKDGEGKDPLKRTVQRAVLPHNSLFKMGLATNARWLHGVRPDKRRDAEKSAAELACEGERISLTFRRIATYLDARETEIWGQGATGKTRDAAQSVLNGQTEQAVAMLRAFGRENQDSEFDWGPSYGAGFDVLHIGDAKRLFLSGDEVVDLRVRALLAEFGVSYARGSFGADGQGTKAAGDAASSLDIPIRFIDNDETRTTVDGQRNILLYLEKTYGAATTTDTDTPDKEHINGRLTRGLQLLDLWRSAYSPDPSALAGVTTRIQDLLSPWEKYASEDAFIAGPKISLPDFAFWPVLRDIFSSIPLIEDENEQAGSKPKFPNLRAYHDRMRSRKGIAGLLGP